MENFSYQNPTRLLFGRGTHKQIGAELKGIAHKVLLHYGGGSIKRNGVYDNVVKSLEENGIEYVELPGVQPNPALSMVRKGIRMVHDNHIDMILAVGGGSVIDSAKAISLGAVYDGDVWDFYLNGVEPQAAMPISVVLTIPAAGSETSDGSVITCEDTHRKLSCCTDIFRSKVSIIDPEIFMTLPQNQMANGVTDMMSHVMERYFTPTSHTDLTDGLCEATLRCMMKNAKLLMHDMHNYDAWAEIGFAGSFGHNNMLGLGRAQDWGCHNMEHELSAYHHIAHGTGLAILTPAWMRYVSPKHPEIFHQFACNVMGVVPSRDVAADIEEGIARLAAFFASIGQPSTLAEAGIDNPDIELMAKQATQFFTGNEQPLGGIHKLYWQDVLAIYKAVL